jgi:transcriptional repressor NrdR
VKCPYCPSTETKVLESRETGEYEEVTRRRRECLKCERRFTTYERAELGDMVVVKKDGRREPFDREKLKKGILKACEKRPIELDKIEQAVDKIETEIRDREEKEIKSTAIGELVMKKLKTLDHVAYIRFASVYREFADIASFQDEMKKLIKKR